MQSFKLLLLGNTMLSLVLFMHLADELAILIMMHVLFFFFSVLCWCFSLFTDVCYSTFFYNQHSFLLFSHFSLYDLEVWLLIMRHIHNLINTLYGRKHVDTQNAFKIKYMGINKGLSFLCCYNILHSSQTIAQSWNRLNVTWIKGPSINIINWGSQTFGRVM